MLGKNVVDDELKRGLGVSMKEIECARWPRKQCSHLPNAGRGPKRCGRGRNATTSIAGASLRPLRLGFCSLAN